MSTEVATSDEPSDRKPQTTEEILGVAILFSVDESYLDSLLFADYVNERTHVHEIWQAILLLRHRAGSLVRLPEEFCRHAREAAQALTQWEYMGHFPTRSPEGIALVQEDIRELGRLLLEKLPQEKSVAVK